MKEENYNHHYRAVELRRGKWTIIEDDQPLTADDKRYPTDEASAKWYALMWNYWGSKYDRNNPKCHERLPLEMTQAWLDIMLKHHIPHAEDEERIAPKSITNGQLLIQPSLWDESPAHKAEKGGQA
jgi:hypothetical protein